MMSSFSKQRTDLNNGVDLTDGGQEFIAKAGSFGGSLDKSGDVNELNGGGDDLGGIGHPGKLVQPGVRNRDHSHIGINGAERVVGSLRIAGARECVEEGGFANIGHSYDSGLKHNVGALAQDRVSGNPQLTT